MSRLWLIALGLMWGLSGSPGSWAGQYRLMPGQAHRVPVGIDVRNHETTCNVEIRIDGGPPFQQTVSAPDFIAWLALAPSRPGSVQVSWRGVFVRTETDQLINPCPTMGSTRFMVSSSNTDILADWQAMWLELGQPMASCLQTALQTQGVRVEWYDRKDPVGSPHDQALTRGRQACSTLLALPTPWGGQSRIGHVCQLGGRATRCDGYYVSTTAKGVRLDERQAIERVLRGERLTAVHVESPATIAARIRAEKAAQVKAEAEEAARVEAFKLALAEQKQRERVEEEARQKAAEEERQRKIKAAEAREREYLENRPWLVRKLSRVQPKPLEEETDPATGKEPSKGNP